MSDELKQRNEILQQVRAFCDARLGKSRFVPGESRVPYAGRVYDGDEMSNAVDACLDFWLTAGRFSEKFEGTFAAYFGLTDAILVNSGSSANLLAIAALTSPKLGDRRLVPGDEVITVAAGFPATVAPIVQNGLIPVFVDVALGTYNATADAIAQAIGPKTRAIFIAHTMGNPFEVAAVAQLARQHNLWLVEDNCDAVGSTFDGKRTGTFGDLATVSFYPAHHITMGEGGCVLTRNPELARIVRSFRDWGRDCYCAGGINNTCGKRFSQQHGALPFGYDHKYVYSHIGYNLKVTDMQAAIGCAQLTKLPGFVEARKRHWRVLSDGLAQYADRLILPEATPGSDPSWFGFVITVRDDAGFTRNDLTAHLEHCRIETRNLFAGNLLRHPAFMDIEHRVAGDLVNSDIVTEQTFFIGCYPGLTPEMLDYMLSAFHAFFSR